MGNAIFIPAPIGMRDCKPAPTCPSHAERDRDDDDRWSPRRRGHHGRRHREGDEHRPR